MKEIKLKPKLEDGEIVLIDGVKHRCRLVGDEIIKMKNCFGFEINSDGKEICFDILEGEFKGGGFCRNLSDIDIIESPSESAGDKMTPTAECEHANPPLKLRVGGVYKARNGKIYEIIMEHPAKDYGFYKFKGKIGFGYNENGRVFDDRECSADLIEEVQPEQECEHKFSYESYRRDDGKIFRRSRCFKCPFVSEVDCNTHPLTENPLEKELKALRQMSVLLGELDCLKKQNAELVKQLKKPEGNPFKVGDRVNVTLGFIYDDPQSGIVKTLNEDHLFVLLDKFPTGAPYDNRLWEAHYKQCEKVDEEN